MEKSERAKTRVLYIETQEINFLDIPRALDRLGYDIYRAGMGTQVQFFSISESRKIIEAIDMYEIHYCISYDFVQSIAQACFETGIPYISWVYDAPQKELYTHYALYPCNYIFVFDREQRNRLREIGIENVYHVPLAILPEKVEHAVQNAKKDYRTDISFVGQLYDISSTEELIEDADEKVRGQIQECVDACLLKWGEDVGLHGRLGSEAVSFLGSKDSAHPGNRYPLIREQFYYETAVISRMLANRERVTILNELSKDYEVCFYTKEKDTGKLSSRVKVRPPVMYDTELSAVYNQSKININITLHCIESGVPQRVFDVMAAGGFLISNYQQELEELFVIGKEIVVFHNLDELRELVRYYMDHEEERRLIAENGRKKVMELHGYADRLDKIFDLVSEKECSRTETYIVQQRKFLIEKANTCLNSKNRTDIQSLYDIMRNRIYETTIEKTEVLDILRELLDCWNCEMEVGHPCVFDDTFDLGQVAHKYKRIKHGLWRIEQQLTEEKCLEGIRYMMTDTVSMIVLGWIIYANMKNRETVYLRTVHYIRQIDIGKALELVTYGLVLLGNNDNLYITKADLLLDMNMWKDALQALKNVENPSNDILEIIAELEAL